MKAGEMLLNDQGAGEVRRCGSLPCDTIPFPARFTAWRRPHRDGLGTRGDRGAGQRPRGEGAGREGPREGRSRMEQLLTGGGGTRSAQTGAPHAPPALPILVPLIPPATRTAP